jgi:hypothetical protein
MAPYAQVSYMIVDTANQDLDMATDPFLEVSTLCYLSLFLRFCWFGNRLKFFIVQYIFVKYDGLQSQELKSPCLALLLNEIFYLFRQE